MLSRGAYIRWRRRKEGVRGERGRLGCEGVKLLNPAGPHLSSPSLMHLIHAPFSLLLPRSCPSFPSPHSLQLPPSHLPFHPDHPSISLILPSLPSLSYWLFLITPSLPDFPCFPFPLTPFSLFFSSPLFLCFFLPLSCSLHLPLLSTLLSLFTLSLCSHFCSSPPQHTSRPSCGHAVRGQGWGGAGLEPVLRGGLASPRRRKKLTADL